MPADRDIRRILGAVFIGGICGTLALSAAIMGFFLAKNSPTTDSQSCYTVGVVVLFVTAILFIYFLQLAAFIWIEYEKQAYTQIISANGILVFTGIVLAICWKATNCTNQCLGYELHGPYTVPASFTTQTIGVYGYSCSMVTALYLMLIIGSGFLAEATFLLIFELMRQNAHESGKSKKEDEDKIKALEKKVENLEGALDKYGIYIDGKGVARHRNGGYQAVNRQSRNKSYSSNNSGNSNGSGNQGIFMAMLLGLMGNK